MIRTLAEQIGNTRLCTLQRLSENSRGNTIAVKLEGDNPAGSVKDRPAVNMIQAAEKRGEISPGDTLIEATSGNTGIALAMAAAIMGYRMVLLMPDNLSMERRASMKAYGAELILVSKDEGGMEGARDIALQMEREGKGKVLNQFANPDNPMAHVQGTGPEIWRDTNGAITHFVSAMGTTGTIMGEINNAMIFFLNGISDRLKPTAAIVPRLVATMVAIIPIKKLLRIERTHCALFQTSLHQPVVASGFAIPLVRISLYHRSE